MTRERPARLPVGKQAQSYAAAGVDIDAAERIIPRIAELAKRTRRPEVLADIGPFGGLFRLGAYRDPVLVASTDSVGTKVKLAALLGRYETLGHDVVNQNVNDVITTGAEPLFFLDYIGCWGLSEDAKVEIVRGVADACRECGCALLGGETADLPGLYAPGELDLVGFAVGVVERDAIIDGSRIAAGDALLALPSSGPHTNGYSLVRQVFGAGLGGDPAEERARLEETYDELGGGTLGEALLAPHRGYWPQVKALLQFAKGIAHVTQGGIAGNLSRVLPEGLGARIDRSAWEVPPLFRLIESRGNVAEEEMFRVFNMGVGIVVAVAPEDAGAVRAKLPEAVVVGEVVQGGGVVWG